MFRKCREQCQKYSNNVKSAELDERSGTWGRHGGRPGNDMEGDLEKTWRETWKRRGGRLDLDDWLTRLAN